MLFQQIARNKHKTVVLLFLFLIILALVGAGAGYLFADSPWTGIIIALGASLIYLLVILRDPAKMVMSLNHAQEIHEDDDPELFHIVQDMAMVGRVPMPRVFIINDPSPNAFATGRDPNHSAVAVTLGLRQMMNREELEGVLGHEISHIRNYDILLSTVAVVLVGVISFISGLASRWLWWFGGFGNNRRDDNDHDNAIFLVLKIIAIVFVLIFGPLAATLAQMALSRNREYLADTSSVELTRDPQGLISALEKIERSNPMKKADHASAGLYIANPFRKSGSLFDTHPPTAKRIARLKKM